MAVVNPDQPIIEDQNGVLRYRANAIVKFLLDAGPFNMNIISCLPGISDDDRRQFAQLIGYSITGYEELPYV